MSAIAVETPLCAEPGRDALVRPLVERSVAYLLDELGADRPHAVILAGSLARGEGSVLPRAGGFRLLGDVEFMVVLRAPIDWTDARRQFLELSRRATRELGGGGRVATIEYGPTGLGYLRRNIRPCIFAHDLVTHGKVVAGQRDILREVRPFGVADIPATDAVELVMNRMVELLVLEDGEGDDDEARGYHLLKTTLDLAGSALAFAGRHVSVQGERAARFPALLESAPDLRAALPDHAAFVVQLERATRGKLAPTRELLLEGDMGARVAAVAGWAKSIWLWEMRRLLGRPAAPFPELLAGYVRHEAMRDRLRGWAKLYLHPLRPRRAFSPWRAGRFLWRTSPRALTYAAALLACWARTGEGAADWPERAAALLPVRRAAGANGLTAGEVGDLWRWLVRND